MKDDPGFGIYIHWPYCQSKCPYCDFNSHVARTINHDDWRRAYGAAIDYWRDYRPGDKLTSIYFGGGTPSLAQPATIAAIIAQIAQIWSIDGAEITLEANPSSVEAANFAAFARAGVNRVSMGFQALNDGDLRRLGRLHGVAEAWAALDIARQYFNRVNFDLIYARQDQSMAAWQDELGQALEKKPDHLSLYQLTIEPETRFGELAQLGRLSGLPSDDLASDMYNWTSQSMIAAGFEHYEVSNFAKPGQASRHNLVYWRYGDYLGIGPGAHGRVSRDGIRQATTQRRAPITFLAQPTAVSTTNLTAGDAGEEYMIFAMRLSEGALRARIEEYGVTLNAQALRDLTADGLIWQSNAAIGATARGRILLNRLILELLA